MIAALTSQDLVAKMVASPWNVQGVYDTFILSSLVQCGNFISHEQKWALRAFKTSFQPNWKMYAIFTQLWVAGVGSQLLYQPRYFYQLVSHGISMVVLDRGMSLDPTLRHFLYKTSSDALMRHYFGNRLGRIYSILDSVFCLPRVTRILKACLGK